MQMSYQAWFTPGEDVEAASQESNQGNSFVRENGVERKEYDELNSGSKNNQSMKDGTESVVSGHLKKTESPRTSGSILLLIEELIKGLTHKAKKDWVKELCVSNKVNFLTLQETKMESIELFDIKRCWGNFAFDYVHSASVGNSGGILCVWDSNSFMKLNATVSDYFVMVRGEVIIMGDFNEVHNKNERLGLIYNVQGANAFNSFISSAGLEEVPLGGCSFIWVHKSASKMSKLDRFLISESLMISCPKFLAITLDKYLSDHHPIILRESTYNYGRILFCYFHYWFEVDGFEKFVKQVWYEALVDASNPMLNLMYKLKYLKKNIHAWNDDIISKRTKVVNSIEEVEKLQSMEAAQKAKIKWAIKGDENSKYYHGILNKKRNQLSIRGVLAYGSWIEIQYW
ncbi:RNA-directed DNA polymerase, eukaryota [Tanacetum coccineum]